MTLFFLFYPMKRSNNTFIGIDVGGPRKGFHAVVMRDGDICGRKSGRKPKAIVEWCLELGASVVGVDAPCMWSTAGKHREAERLLNQAGMHCFYTPTRERAQGNPFYSWMLNGEKLFQALLKHFSLYTGQRNAKRVCFETFPHAIVCALKGEIVPAHPKTSVRREVLRTRGLDTSSLSNIDLVDAALCAVAAEAFRRGEFDRYGDQKEGYVVLPRKSYTRAAVGV
jgi:predicted nuclease with RNAse H fold